MPPSQTLLCRARRYISTFRKRGVFVSPQLGSASTLIGGHTSELTQPPHDCIGGCMAAAHSRVSATAPRYLQASSCLNGKPRSSHRVSSCVPRNLLILPHLLLHAVTYKLSLARERRSFLFHGGTGPP